MSNELKEMFAMNENETASTGTRGLAGTAQLTSLAATAAQEVFNQVNSDPATYSASLKESMTDHTEMDKLIKTVIDLETIDVTFLKELSSDVTMSMLKSQQSKRSRLKSKVMTLDNYKNMMTAAVAELLLRQVMGKEKSSSGYRRGNSSLEYTAEEIELYKNDQEVLRKELRNVQSKKSIMKSREDFTEEDERWTQLLAAEALLKSLRVNTGGTRTVVVDRAKEQLKAELGDKDVDSLKASEVKAMLKRLLETTTNEEVATAEEVTEGGEQ